VPSGLLRSRAVHAKHAGERLWLAFRALSGCSTNSIPGTCLAVRSSMTPNASHLLFGGDWACAHGDPAGLANVARQLAARVDEPLRLELIGLSQLCRHDLAGAARRWPLLRELFVERTSS
jgi:hypothetical protein